MGHVFPQPTVKMGCLYDASPAYSMAGVLVMLTRSLSLFSTFSKPASSSPGYVTHATIFILCLMYLKDGHKLERVEQMDQARKQGVAVVERTRGWKVEVEKWDISRSIRHRRQGQGKGEGGGRVGLELGAELLQETGAQIKPVHGTWGSPLAARGLTLLDSF